LEAVLEAGPAACGWSDQCWTLARIAEIVRHRTGVEYTLVSPAELKVKDGAGPLPCHLIAFGRDGSE